MAGGRAARGDQRARPGAVAGPDELPRLGGIRHPAGAGHQPRHAPGRRPGPGRPDRAGRGGGGDPGRAGRFPAAARGPGPGGRSLSGDARRCPGLRSRGGGRGRSHGGRDGLADLAGGECWPGGRRPGGPGPGRRPGPAGAAVPGRADLRNRLGPRDARHPARAAARGGPDRGPGAQHRGQRGGGSGRAHRGAGLLGQPGAPAGHTPAVRGDLGRLRQQHAAERGRRGDPRPDRPSRRHRVVGRVLRSAADRPGRPDGRDRHAARSPR